jgi:CheY-like chemotaxis protein
MIDPTERSILIVDDDRFLLDMYSLKFKERGFAVHAALGSMEALERLQEGVRPDVVLLDIVMPAMDGFEFLEKVKKEHLTGEAKLIVLSNLGQQSDVDKASRLGADGYIVKASATPSEVVTKVLEVLGD